MRVIKVGVVGASGWAAGSHLPALAGLAEFEVAAVATTRRASVARVAEAHGVPLAFTDAAELVSHPDVGLVVVSVKAPGHAELIRAAVRAGKHVLSEWPLTVGPGEADELARLATGAGVTHAVCLQGYWSPDARFVADLLAGGRIGRVVSAALSASGAPFGGGSVPAELEWATDPAGGSSILTIMAGHFLATFEAVVGEFAEVSARLPRRHDRITVAGTDRTVPNRTPDDVLVRGVLRDGATASVTVRGGSGSPDGFLFEVVGSRGTLTAVPTRPDHYPHWTDWEIRVDGEPVTVPAGYRRTPFGPAAGPVAGIAELYLEVARAIAEGRPPHPDFHTAARLHRLLATIEAAARTGGTAPVR
ncbi:Gfo/Idh/MocA family protein [Saccharothrix carnea]|uniref:Gfo/Idh/MocA family protein n=1 Tax=Saccharothrix carnea TaxID=1280637 RepID=UPI001C62CEFB|nr:Gfo/Idh/MocA family oxidoreductase [Saccharothrix carnea]